jgi:ubiquinone/menaquinone biosynthesis C-methylase UbiE
MLNIARSRVSEDSFVQGGAAFSLPFPDSSFDGGPYCEGISKVYKKSTVFSPVAIMSPTS